MIKYYDLEFCCILFKKRLQIFECIMQDFKLTEQEVVDLINRYKSEVRKLEYQIRKTRETIADLEGRGVTQFDAAMLVTPEPPRRKRGRPAGSTAKKQEAHVETATAVEEAPKPRRKRGRPKGSTNKKKVIRS